MSRDLQQIVRDALMEVDDPELGVSIVDLGLVRAVEIAGGHVQVTLITTTPTCPLGGLMAETATAAVSDRLGSDWIVTVSLDRNTVWSPDMAAPETRAAFERRPVQVLQRLKAGLAGLFTRS